MTLVALLDDYDTVVSSLVSMSDTSSTSRRLDDVVYETCLRTTATCELLASMLLSVWCWSIRPLPETLAVLSKAPACVCKLLCRACAVARPWRIPLSVSGIPVETFVSGCYEEFLSCRTESAVANFASRASGKELQSR